MAVLEMNCFSVCLLFALIAFAALAKIPDDTKQMLSREWILAEYSYNGSPLDVNSCNIRSLKVDADDGLVLDSGLKVPRVSDRGSKYHWFYEDERGNNDFDDYTLLQVTDAYAVFKVVIERVSTGTSVQLHVYSTVAKLSDTVLDAISEIKDDNGLDGIELTPDQNIDCPK